MTVGDQTALAVYLAAQPRPVTLLELDYHGLLDPPLTSVQKGQINRGRATFMDIGCAACHVPNLRLDDPVFSEPSQNPAYRDSTFPAGQDPLAAGLDPAFAVTFDLTEDQPDNQIVGPNGEIVHLGSLRTDSAGRAIVELFGDLKRHDIGAGLAENIDEVGTGASVFLTENLWGVGSTAPYLHDGRATTLTEAILEHGGEAAASKNAFVNLITSKQQDVIAFLDNLVLFKVAEPEAIRGVRGPLASN
jgi:cytochrome c peroxidase